jgi:hypothetical protein
MGFWLYSISESGKLTKIAFFMDKQLAQHRTQEQGSRIAAAAHLNYEFAMYRRRGRFFNSGLLSARFLVTFGGICLRKNGRNRARSRVASVTFAGMTCH